MPTKRKIRHPWKRRDKGFIWADQRANAQYVAEQAAHQQAMTRLQRVRGLADFSAEELQVLQAKLEGWVATHAGLGAIAPW